MTQDGNSDATDVNDQNLSEADAEYEAQRAHIQQQIQHLQAQPYADLMHAEIAAIQKQYTRLTDAHDSTKAPPQQ